MRPSGRGAEDLRSVRFLKDFVTYAEGSVLTEFGNTRVLVTASLDRKVPHFLKGRGEGWVTAEYGMLPRATHTRNFREAARGKQSGRTLEIQRLIGRSLRMQEGELERNPIHGQVAGVSVGIYKGQPILDLDYDEDSEAETDMNVVMNEAGGFIEIQGTAEGHAFQRGELENLLDLAEEGIRQLVEKQAEILGG